MITALPRFRHVQELFAAADAVALQSDLQTVGRVFRAEAVLFPRKSPIKTVRPLVRIGFFREKVPAAQVESEFRVEIVLRRGLGDGALERSSRA